MLRAVAPTRALGVLALWLSATVAHGAETLRISMGEEPGPVQLSARVLSFGEDVEDGTFHPLSSGRATVTRSRGKLLLDGVPVVGDTVRFRAGEWAVDAGVPGRDGVKAAGFEVRGDVVVKLKGDRLLLVNVIPLEDYLFAVLGGEMPVSFPPEALRAQAVAARTYALRKKIETYGADFHLGSSVLHQVYGGLEREDPRTHQAVESTRGLVLTYDLEPIEAYFHSSCGGKTESGLSALNRDLPYLQPVECPCGKLPASRWTLTLPAQEIRALAPGADERSFSVVARTATGRARRVKVGPDRTLDAVAFRERIGYTRVKSLSFEVERSPRDGSLVFSGRGYGHGAGLCQWGAKALADQGWDFKRILGHYYPGAELQQLY